MSTAVHMTRIVATPVTRNTL